VSLVVLNIRLNRLLTTLQLNYTINNTTSTESLNTSKLHSESTTGLCLKICNILRCDVDDDDDDDDDVL